MSYLTLWRNTDFDRLFDTLWYGGKEENGGGPVLYAPSYELSEDGDKYVLSFDLPGVAKSDLQVEIRENALHVSGERRNYGKFQRALRLPGDVNPDRIEAHLQDGVLTVTLAKSESAKPRRISVTGGEAAA